MVLVLLRFHWNMCFPGIQVLFLTKIMFAHFIHGSSSVSCSVMSNSLGPTDCSLPGYSVDGIIQTKVLAWVAMPFSRRSSWPRDQIWVPHIADRFFTIWATREAWWKQKTLMYSFLNPESISCPIQGSNFCFLTHIQVSQETSKMVSYSHILKSFL